MKRTLVPLALASCLILPGCGSDSGSPKAEKDLRDQMGQKQIDFTKVAPDQRALVLGQMRANGASAKADELERQWGTKK